MAGWWEYGGRGEMACSCGSSDRSRYLMCLEQCGSEMPSLALVRGWCVDAGLGWSRSLLIDFAGRVWHGGA